jgi:rhamnose utilization protein RhaD (predicted bifunctional aldolase and dehydrogenase)
MTLSLTSLRDELLALSHHLGEEQREYAIIGEGNTSARTPSGSILIKSSGSSLRTLAPDQVVEVDARAVTAPLGSPNDAPLDDAGVKRVLGAARCDPDSAWPSIETFFHALLYELTDAMFIGHTHPVAVNAVLCSQRAHDITRHIMPDVIVVCGLHAVFVPYIDPGLALAREIGARTRAFSEAHGEAPRTIYLQNHGLIALGQTPRQVQNITAMAVKHAKVLAATYSLGGPRFLNDADNARIESRPDEDVRRRQFK